MFGQSAEKREKVEIKKSTHRCYSTRIRNRSSLYAHIFRTIKAARIEKNKTQKKGVNSDKRRRTMERAKNPSQKKTYVYSPTGSCVNSMLQTMKETHSKQKQGSELPVSTKTFLSGITFPLLQLGGRIISKRTECPSTIPFPRARDMLAKECLRRRVSFHKVSAFKIGQLCIMKQEHFLPLAMS